MLPKFKQVTMIDLSGLKKSEGKQNERNTARKDVRDSKIKRV